MPKIAKPLGALEVGRLSGSGLHAVGTVAGLYLSINANGARSWILRTKVGSRRTDTRVSPSPSYAWAKLQLRNNHELKAAYQQAVEDRADRLAEELMELADTPMPEGLDGPGRSAWVQQLRLRVDVRKWAASKLKPKTYGDRLDLSVTHEPISIIEALKTAQLRVFDSQRTIEMH